MSASTSTTITANFFPIKYGPVPPVVHKSDFPNLGFGEVTGEFDGVAARSNLDSYFFSGISVYESKVYAGIAWQCVCYARRTVLLRQGVLFGQCGPAGEMVGNPEFSHVTDVETGAEIPWTQHKNGATAVKPATGAVVLYPIINPSMPVGHIAIISAVSDELTPDPSDPNLLRGFVGVAEENEGSKSWGGLPWSRTQPLIYKKAENVWEILETEPGYYPACWVHVEGRELYRRAADTPLKPLPDFVTEGSVGKAQLARFAGPLAAVDAPDFAAQPDDRDKTAEAEQHKTKKQLLVEIREGRTAAKLARRKILVAYNALMSAAYTSATASVASAQQHHLPHAALEAAVGCTDNNTTNNNNKSASSCKPQLPFSRAAVPRTRHIASVYSPNQAIGMSSISAAISMYNLVQAAASYHLLNVVNDSNLEAEAARFGFPSAEIFKKTIAQVKHQVENPPASSCTRLDYGIGTIGFTFQDRKRGSAGGGGGTDFKILHTELDSLFALIEINQQERYVRHAAKLQAGWVMTTYGNDFTRMVRNFLAERRHAPANSAVVFLDFGPADQLASRLGLTDLSPQLRYAYEVERYLAMYLCEFLIEYLFEKQHDFAEGTLTPDETEPSYKVKRFNFFDDEQVQLRDGRVFFKDDKRCPAGGCESTPAEVVMKMCPWSHLFALMSATSSSSSSSSSNAAVNKLNVFVSEVATNVSEPTVLQPLWTAVATQPAFLPLLSTYAKKFDTMVAPGTCSLVDDARKWLTGTCNFKSDAPDLFSRFTIPVECWRSDECSINNGVPACDFLVEAHSPALGPLNPGMTHGDSEGYSPPPSPVKKSKSVDAFDGAADAAKSPTLEEVNARLQEHGITASPDHGHGDDAEMADIEHVHPALHVLVIGGKRSAMMGLEARTTTAEDSPIVAAAVAGAGAQCGKMPCIYEVLHPAAWVYMPMLFAGNRGIQKREATEEEESDHDAEKK